VRLNERFRRGHGLDRREEALSLIDDRLDLSCCLADGNRAGLDMLDQRCEIASRPRRVKKCAIDGVNLVSDFCRPGPGRPSRRDASALTLG
jgi:hypothetical protein